MYSKDIFQSKQQITWVTTTKESAITETHKQFSAILNLILKKNF